MPVITNKKTNEAPTKKETKRLAISLAVSLALIALIIIFTVDLGADLAEPPEYTEEEMDDLSDSLVNTRIVLSPSDRTSLFRFMGMKGVKELHFRLGDDGVLIFWFLKRGGADPLLFRDGIARYRGDEYSFYMVKGEGGDELRLRHVSTGNEWCVVVND